MEQSVLVKKKIGLGWHLFPAKTILLKRQKLCGAHFIKRVDCWKVSESLDGEMGGI